MLTEAQSGNASEQSSFQSIDGLSGDQIGPIPVGLAGSNHQSLVHGWFAYPRGQTQRLIDFLHAREQFVPENSFDELEDEILEDFEPEIMEEVQDVIEKAKADKADPISESDAPEVFSDIGDRITYETLDGVRERHTVQIVDSPSNLRLGLLNDETPLA